MNTILRIHALYIRLQKGMLKKLTFSKSNIILKIVIFEYILKLVVLLSNMQVFQSCNIVQITCKILLKLKIKTNL